MGKKICSQCKIEKDTCEFHKGNGKDGFQYKCKDCKKQYSTLNVVKENNRKNTWAKKNLEKIKESKKKYYKNNIKKEQLRNNQYIKNKKKTDFVFKISCILRTRLNEYLKIRNITKSNKTFYYIGCTPQFLKEYLENKFTIGMSWENHGEWHIDHIVPLSSANNESDLYKLCHYTNLQPLWAEENLKKSNKII